MDYLLAQFPVDEVIPMDVEESEQPISPNCGSFDQNWNDSDNSIDIDQESDQPLVQQSATRQSSRIAVRKSLADIVGKLVKGKNHSKTSYFYHWSLPLMK